MADDPNVPLVVPEVEPQNDKHKGIIANPNCSTIQAVVALKPLYDKYGIRRIVYSTYQAVSGAGLGGYEDLKNGIHAEPPTKFPYPIFGNCIPHIDVFLDNGYTKEEMKMVNETRKILGDDSLRITADNGARSRPTMATARASMWNWASPYDLSELRDVLAHGKGIVVVDDPEKPEIPHGAGLRRSR